MCLMTTSHTEHDRSADHAAIEVGARIYGMAWKRRISQRELGAVIGVSQGTMGRKLRGSVPITIAELFALASYLGTDPRDLLPRLDSNQQPSGWTDPQVSEVPGVVVDLAAWRARREERAA